MTVKTRKWDASEHLDSEEMIFAYMNEVFEDGDPSLIAAAIGDVARARGMTQIAKTAGVSRESLYKALREGANPEFATIMKILRALHIRISVSKAENDDIEERIPA